MVAELIEKLVDVGYWAYKRPENQTVEARMLYEHKPVQIDDYTFTGLKEFTVYRVGHFIQDNIPDADVIINLDGNDSNIELSITDEDQEKIEKKLTELLTMWGCV